MQARTGTAAEIALDEAEAVAVREEACGLVSEEPSAPIIEVDVTDGEPMVNQDNADAAAAIDEVVEIINARLAIPITEPDPHKWTESQKDAAIAVWSSSSSRVKLAAVSVPAIDLTAWLQRATGGNYRNSQAREG